MARVPSLGALWVTARNTPGAASQRGPKVHPFDGTANTSEVFFY